MSTYQDRTTGNQGELKSLVIVYKPSMQTISSRKELNYSPLKYPLDKI